MPPLPAKIEDRLVTAIKRFQPILVSAKARDVNESDTVIIVTDMLSELFGYDKYSEITSEHAIRGTYCDLAISIESKVEFLLETKAIGIELKDSHVKQAVDYAANKGVDWVVLTNAAVWRIYRVTFTKPIDHELVVEFNFLTLNSKIKDEVATIYLMTREGLAKKALGGFHEHRQALSRFSVAAAVLSEPVVGIIRRELKRLSPDVRIECEQICDVLLREVLKREVVEGDKADEAQRKLAKAACKALKSKKAGDAMDAGDVETVTSVSVAPSVSAPVSVATKVKQPPQKQGES